MNWQAGTFTTETLIKRIQELLGEVNHPELTKTVTEYMRLSENAKAAYYAAQGMVQYVGRCSDGCWVKNGKKYPNYEAMKADG